MEPVLVYDDPAEVPPLTFNAFVRNRPSKSIALDGYVRGGPQYDDLTQHINFNHHEDVDRLATRATCGQVAIALRQGLADLIYPNGEEWTVYVNDCDEDVSLSWFLLCNPHFVGVGANPLLSKLLNLEDMLDCTSGAYPIPESLKVLCEMAWIFQPYRTVRKQGKWDAITGQNVIYEVGERIMAYITGRGGSLPLDTRHNVLSNEDGWALVEEVGAQARQGMAANGIRAFISVRENHDGTYTYTLGRSSQFVQFPVQYLLQKLDAHEPKYRGWGGGDMIGGSPRGTGSELAPTEVCEIVRNALARS